MKISSILQYCVTLPEMLLQLVKKIDHNSPPAGNNANNGNMNFLLESIKIIRSSISKVNFLKQNIFAVNIIINISTCFLSPEGTIECYNSYSYGVRCCYDVLLYSFNKAESSTVQILWVK